jgi:hypothetical protein
MITPEKLAIAPVPATAQDPLVLRKLRVAPELFIGSEPV